MTYGCDKYGIEYNPRRSADDSSFRGPTLVLVALLAMTAATIVGVRRLRVSRADGCEPAAVKETSDRPAAPHPSNPAKRVETETVPPPVIPVQAIPRHELPPSAMQQRPQNVRNLLLRLKEAVKKNDLPMAVTTIEKIRALPGEPAADLDDDLARQLGALNYRWLIEGRNSQWVESVTVKPGDSLDRISKERGATCASTLKLNPTVTPARIKPGQVVAVMKHPHFRLTVCRCAKTADLYLNNRFFKRYDLTATPTAQSGAYELNGTLRKFLNDNGIALAPEDRAELEMLMPHGSSVLVAEK